MDHRLIATDRPAPARYAGLLVALTARAVGFVATLLGAGALVLTLLVLAPGDPVDLLPNADQVRGQLEAEWRLDQGLVERYAHYLGNLARGDLGVSLAYRPGLSVREVIAGPAWRSLTLLIGGLGLALTWGTALAWVTARAPRPSRLGTGVRLISIAPVFLLAHLAVTGLNELAMAAMDAGLIARPDWFALPTEPSSFRTALAVVLLAVGSGTLTEVHREAQDALLAIRRSGYVVAARARGAPLWPHILPNLMLPLTTIATTRSVFLVGGLVILERVLLLNGAGSVLWQAALLRDYDLALAAALLAAAATCTLRLLGDGLRIALDPRLRSLERP